MHLVPNESSTCCREGGGGEAAVGAGSAGGAAEGEAGAGQSGWANLPVRTSSSSRHKLLNKFIKIIPVADVVAPSGRPRPSQATPVDMPFTPTSSLPLLPLVPLPAASGSRACCGRLQWCCRYQVAAHICGQAEEEARRGRELLRQWEGGACGGCRDALKYAAASAASNGRPQSHILRGRR